ncbi:unnamed protein product [Urochloa humidicola]
MLPCLTPAATVLCPALLLLALLSSPTTTISTQNTSLNPCAPASCGGLNITFPFWLAGTHPPECGHKAYQVSCNKKGKASLVKSFWDYKILNIFYGNSSFILANMDLSDPNSETCFELFSNASTDLAAAPFTISSQNLELFFVFDCDPRPQHGRHSWSYVNCTDNSPSSFALLAGNYTPNNTRTLTPLPRNCNVSMMPVLGYKGATGADYQRLLKRGFLLEYLDAGPCSACTETGGKCRVDGSDDTFHCLCTNGGHGFICGRKWREVKIIRIVLMAAAASLLFPCIYVMVCYRKGQILRLLLGKNTISSTERNIEALIVSYGSLAPKRYKYSE